jgi:hypothetical protein
MKFSASNNHFWDSCTLIRFITQNPPELIGDMSKILDDARSKKRKIWISNILFAEFRPSLLAANSKFTSMDEFISDIEGVLFPIAANMEIVLQAARMRDHVFHRAEDVRQATEKNRVLTVPDSIQLSTCLFVKEAYGISDIEFHTFDDGKGKNYEDKAVSLLSLENYAEHITTCPEIEAVRNLTRIKPALSSTLLI